MTYHFFALYSRMKHINRWALMRNTQFENLSQHSCDVAAIAHCLATIKNVRFGGCLNAEKAAFFGLYHDMPEIITGDMPTPVKYYNETMRSQFGLIEKNASEHLLGMLPDDLRPYYEHALLPNEEDAYLWRIVKAADKISALIKCIEEEKAGNREFKEAYESTLESINKMQMEEVGSFMSDFIESYRLSLDEQK